jgi:hypothetical protein
MLPSPNARWKRITLRGPGQSPALTFAGFLSASIRILANPNRENGDKAATDQRLELTSRTTKELLQPREMALWATSGPFDLQLLLVSAPIKLLFLEMGRGSLTSTRLLHPTA